MDRRQFLISGTAGAAVLGSLSCATTGSTDGSGSPSRRRGQSVQYLHAPAMARVRIGMIGLGNRGSRAVQRLDRIEGVEIRALCDVRSEIVENSQRQLGKDGKPNADSYITDELAWQKMCERDDIDLVYICTPWDQHTPQAVYAMKHGKHVAVEVPAALTIEECWQLVDTSEETQRHCMMLENVCYGFFEMMTLNMVRQGILGDMLHAECSYIHDLRQRKFSETDGYWNRWRLKQSMRRTGNLYPTHGLGPVAQCFDINRGDRLVHLVSMSTRQSGLSLYAEEHYGRDSWEAKQEYSLGDMNTTIVHTSQGRTIMIQYDTTSPRPYSRIHLMSGTRGIIRKYPSEKIALEPNPHEWLNEEEMANLGEKYKHPLERRMGEVASEVGGHGGMDYLMDWRLIHCLREGIPVDQPVYDGVMMSSISALSEQSVKNNGMRMDVPDFTRGDWKSNKQVEIIT
jgi:predicted dehydrogenase